MKIKLVLLISTLIISQFSLAQTISFPNACSSGTSIVIAAVGDVLLHMPLQKKGSEHGYASLWSEITPFIKTCDVAYANLEGPMAPGIHNGGPVYTSFPLFNYHPNLASALKNSGFSIVSTANNHILDRFSIGIDKTIGNLNKVGLAYAGTKPKGSKQSWFSMTTNQGIKIAWISCTEHTNGNIDSYKQVLYCYKKKDRQWIINTIRELKSTVDAIIVTPHWGEEYIQHPNDEQIIFAHQVLNAGATAVIGSHPHVLQPLEKYITRDGRATLIQYSLGNFVSYQGAPNRRSTVLLFIGLTKTPQGTIINGVKFMPLYMQNRNGVSNIHLSKIKKDDDQSTQYISRVMPMGNAIYSFPIITNPECQASQ